MSEDIKFYRPSPNTSGRHAREATAMYDGDVVVVYFHDGCYAYYKSGWLRDQAEAAEVKS